LIVLAFFAISYGWVGIPEHFPLLGGLIPNWFHEFIGSTLAEVPAAVPFNIVPLLTSLTVALGGLFFGWLAYRKVKSPAEDRLQIPLLKNKYYFDEAYNFLFVRPAFWVAETLVYKWMDKGLIDGILHAFGKVAMFLGTNFRSKFDAPVVNGFGDLVGESTKKFGAMIRPIQTGRIQQYMLASLTVLIVVGGLLYYLLVLA
jgi:NADH-quinone oxidoreductase subunit L